MTDSRVLIAVRSPAEEIHILDVCGDITKAAKDPLDAAYSAAGGHAGTVVLNLSGVPFIDSQGAGLLIALQARARRHRQQLLAFGLGETCRRAFRVTHLDEVVELYADEAGALASLGLPAPGLGTGEPATASRASRPGRWADPVDRLRLPALPKEAVNTNTEGRRPTGPVEGFGSLWRRTYTIRLAGTRLTPAEVVSIWKERFGSFWPPAGRFYGANRPIEAGDMALLNLAGPAGVTIATGILVAYSGDDSFCFLSAEGHMFGGMITFSVHKEKDLPVAQVEALLRASDPLFEIVARLGLITRPEDRFWQGTLENLAAHFGVTGQAASLDVALLDPGFQWRQAGRIWYNGAIRSTLYMPLRWLRGQGR